MNTVESMNHINQINRVNMPQPIYKKPEYQRHTNNFSKLISTDNERLTTKLKLTNLHLVVPKPLTGLQVNHKSMKSNKIKDFHSQLVIHSKHDENRNLNEKANLKLSPVNDNAKIVIEEPETYFNGCSNDVSRISDRININSLLEDEPVSESRGLEDISSCQRSLKDFDHSETQFGELRILLKELFLNNRINGYDRCLNGDEVALLSAVLEKKLSTKLVVRQIYNLQDIRIVDSLLPKKRAEECCKFVFKLAFKHLQTKFAERLNVKTSTNDLLLYQFYTYYFGDTAKNQKIDIKNFYLPLTSDVKNINSKQMIAKTINATYISLVSRSELFVQDIIAYLENQLSRDFEQLVDNKVNKTVNKWISLYNSSFCKFRCIEGICLFIVYNKKTKLPWFSSEVEEARRIVLQTILKKIPICTP